MVLIVGAAGSTEGLMNLYKVGLPFKYTYSSYALLSSGVS